MCVLSALSTLHVVNCMMYPYFPSSFFPNNWTLRSPRIRTLRAARCRGAVALRRCCPPSPTSRPRCSSPEAPCNRACTRLKVRRCAGGVVETRLKVRRCAGGGVDETHFKWIHECLQKQYSQILNSWAWSPKCPANGWWIWPFGR